MPQDDTVNSAIENADNWALARNPVYRNLQQKLIERTTERDVLRYVHSSSVSIAHVCMSYCDLTVPQRAAYLELVRMIGPDIFDDVPDRFNIRALIAQEQHIQEQLNSI